MCLAPALLVVCGCVGPRIPAIDPSGRSIFLPNPNFTTLDGPFARLLHGGATGNAAAAGPYRPALLNRHREHFSQLLRRHDGSRLAGLHDGIHDHMRGFLAGVHGLGSGFLGHLRESHLQWPSHSSPFHRSPRSNVFGNAANAPAFGSQPDPPKCGPDGNAPLGSPCYPVGSPTQSSLSATIPGSAGRVGSGLACQSGNCGNQLLSTQQATLAQQMTQLGPGVVLAKPRILAPVGEEVVVVGGVQSTSGVARTDEPVQWSLANNSVGTIIDAARPSTPQAQPRRLLGFLHHKSATPKSVGAGGCGNCVQSVTSNRCDVLTRNPLKPNDDVYLSRGQTWVSLTSGSEGTSYVTLSAPNLEGCRQKTARIEWIDADWDCPRPVMTSMEGPGRLVTKVCRNSDGRPLNGWTVRYIYLDGPRVRLGNSDDDLQVESTTDANGNAVVDAYPIGTEPGTTRVGIQIIDPRIPNEPLGECVGFVTWSSSVPVGQTPAGPEPTPARPPVRPPTIPSDTPTTPITPPPRTQPPFGGTTTPAPASRDASLAIDIQAPEQANIGEQLPYLVTVRNTSNTTAENVIVSTPVPRSLKFLGSRTVQPRSDRNDLGWEIGDLRPGEKRTIDAFYEALDLGRVENVFFSQAANASERSNGASTDVAGGGFQLGLLPSNPIRVGEVATTGIQLRNDTNRPLQVDLRVHGWPESGLRSADEPNTSAEPGLESPEAITILPGASDSIPFRFQGLRPGTHSFVVTATGPGGAVEDQQGIVQVLEAPRTQESRVGAAIGVEGLPDNRIQAGGEDSIRIRLTNTGTVALTNVRIRAERNSDDFDFTSWTGEPTRSNDKRVLTWEQQRIEPGQNKLIVVRLGALRNPLEGGGAIRVQAESEEGVMENEPIIPIEIVEDAFGGTQAFRPNVDGDSKQTLNTAIKASREAVRVGETIDYLITVTNNHSRGFRDVRVSMEIADGMKFVNVTGPPATRTTVSGDGLQLSFSSVKEIRPNETLQFRAKVIPKRSGIAKLLGRVDAIGLPKTLSILQETTVN